MCPKKRKKRVAEYEVHRCTPSPPVAASDCGKCRFDPDLQTTIHAYPLSKRTCYCGETNVGDPVVWGKLATAAKWGPG